jgi:viroplasmin and RNaseH domain-containing protein
MPKKYYAVRKGRVPGIYDKWDGEDGAKAQVIGFKGAEYKGFSSREEAEEYMGGGASQKIQLTGIDYEVYTDGSYFDGRYSYGLVFVKDGELIYEDHGVGEDEEAATMRNVAGEILGVIKAVNKAKEMGVKIRIYHDYSGLAHWVSGEWKAKNKFTKQYAEFMRENEGVYEFAKVKSHSGVKWNEYVDELAKKALEII